MAATNVNVTEEFLKQLLHHFLSNNQLSNYTKTIVGCIQLRQLNTTTLAEYNYQNTLRFFHFYANIEFPKRMERQLLRLTLQTRFRKAFW